MKQAVGRVLVRYYLSFRISAAVALPEFSSFELQDPAPVVRQLPGRMRGQWDERELIDDGRQEWIVTRDARHEPSGTILLN